MTKDKRIISLCDYSGNWCKPYRDAGYEVIQVDLKFGQDIRLLKYMDDVYGVLAAPPCTHFSVSGAQYWKKKGDVALLEGLALVDACLRFIVATRPVFWALENPVGRLKDYIGKPTMYFNPCDYGDPYTKKTCLWGKFNMPVKHPVEPEFVIASNGDRYSKIHMSTGGKSEKTKEVRSITPMGFAKAFYEANK
jgi:hypothetical protein